MKNHNRVLFKNVYTCFNKHYRLLTFVKNPNTGRFPFSEIFHYDIGTIPYYVWTVQEFLYYNDISIVYHHTMLFYDVF